MANVNVFENHLTFGGVKYFRGKAESVMPGDQGEIKRPVFGQNYLSIQDNLPANKLKVDKVTITTIDFAKSKKGDVTGGLNAVAWSGSADAAWDALKEGTLKLVKFEMTLGALRDAYNDAPQARGRLDDYGSDARVAHEIFVVMSAKYASAFNNSGTIAASKAGGKLSLSVNASGSTTVTVSAGSTYAYLLADPKWDGKGDGRKISSFKDDQWGLS